MQFLDMGIAAKGIRWLTAALCELLYQFIGWMFGLFMNVTKVNILSSDDVAPIYQRVTMILTIIMIFYVTFEFVKYVVQPDRITDKEKGAGKVIYKMILVVVLIAFVPSIFTWAYKFQSIIVDRGIIGKVIIGNTGSDPEKFGTTFSANLLSLFYKVDDSIVGTDETCENLNCETLVNMNLGMLANNGKLPYLTIGLYDTKKVATDADEKKVEIPKIDFAFHGFLPVIVGGFIVYILALYCVDVGVRWAQLIYLQLIAPIPIIGYLAPNKDGPFHKWVKQCITTYLDLFIRISIIYVVLLLCSVLLNSKSEMLANVDPDLQTFVYIILILGVLLFAQKAPKLLGELFPNKSAASGNFGLKGGERIAPLAARAIGGALGAKRAVGGLIARAHNRHARNKANGAKMWFTKEGTAQARERRKHRQESRQAGKDASSAEKARKRVSDAELAQGKDKVRQAKERLDRAKISGNKNEIESAERELKDAGKKYRQLVQDRAGTKDAQEERKALHAARRELEAARQSGDANKIAQSEAKVRSAEKAYKDAITPKIGDSNAAEKRNEAFDAGSKLSQSKAAAQEAQQEEAKARKELEDAQASGDSTKIKEAEDRVKLAEENTKNKNQQVQEAEALAKEKAKQYNDMIFGGQEKVEELKGKHADALSQVAEDNNQKYGSVIGSGLWGAVAGGVTGATHGMKATKASEIISKAKEGAKADVKNIQELNKYYDDGGNVGFIGGGLDRMVNKIEKNIGMDTAYARKNLESQSIASQIKKYDETISRADSAKKAFDDTENRLKSKVADSKVIVSEDTQIDSGVYEHNPDGTIKLDSNRKPISKKINIKKDQNIADISRAEKRKATDLETAAEDKLKAQQEHARQNLGILSKVKTSLAGTELDEYNRIAAEQERLKREATEASEQAAEQKQVAESIDKYAARYTFTQMLRGVPGNYDAVAMQFLQDQRESIKIASQDVEIREALRRMVENRALSSTDFNAFLSGTFDSYDQLDHVISSITTARNNISRTKQAKQDQKTRIESSNITQAQKAGSDWAGSGK